MKLGTHAVTVPVIGLSCGGGGALSAEHALARVPGVSRVYVNPWTEMAYIEFEPTAATEGDLAAALERVGLHAGHISRSGDERPRRRT